MQVFREDVQSCNVYMSLQSMTFPAYIEGMHCMTKFGIKGHSLWTSDIYIYIYIYIYTYIYNYALARFCRIPWEIWTNLISYSQTSVHLYAKLGQWSESMHTIVVLPSHLTCGFPPTVFIRLLLLCNKTSQLVITGKHGACTSMHAYFLF